VSTFKASYPSLAPPPEAAGAGELRLAGAARVLRRLKRALFRLRPEEVIALVFLLPTTYLTLAAWRYALGAGLLGDRELGGVWRLGTAAALLLGMGLGLRRWPGSRAVRLTREVLPFLACILIYTNLHDTIGFVNTHDVHHTLDALDRVLFGVQPCLWTERFITPARTELMQFLYLSFVWIAPSPSILLLVQRRWREFRTVTLGTIVCFYIGYALYVALPAAPPRLVLVYEFTRSLEGYSRLFSNISAQAFALLPVDSRAAFPSLHAAVSLVALVFSWRYLRAWFWVLLPFVIGLWASTIYLRHHYTVDLIAGGALVPLTLALAPRLDRWWSARQKALGLETARGAEAPLPLR
jgi:membrane-associated phospholipid phosphatase